MVVTDPDKKLTIGATTPSRSPRTWRRSSQRLDPEDHARTKIVDSASYLADHLGEVPVLVIPCVLDRPPPGPGDAPGRFLGWDPARGVELQLALRSRGLGSAWTTLHLNYEREVAELLGVPDTVTQAALLFQLRITPAKTSGPPDGVPSKT